MKYKNMNTIPIELVNHIMQYRVGKCHKCHQLYNFKNLINNYKLKEYRSVFDDYYGMEPYSIYYRICK